MHKIGRPVFVACLTALMLLSTAVARAGGSFYYSGHGYSNHGYAQHNNSRYGHSKYNHGYRHNKHKRRNRNAGYFLGGLAVGALLYSYNRPHYRETHYSSYYRHQNRYSAPSYRYAPVRRYDDTRYQYQVRTPTRYSSRLLRDRYGDCFAIEQHANGSESRRSIDASNCAW